MLEPMNEASDIERARARELQVRIATSEMERTRVYAFRHRVLRHLEEVHHVRNPTAT